MEVQDSARLSRIGAAPQIPTALLRYCRLFYRAPDAWRALLAAADVSFILVVSLALVVFPGLPARVAVSCLRFVRQVGHASTTLLDQLRYPKWAVGNTQNGENFATFTYRK